MKSSCDERRRGSGAPAPFRCRRRTRRARGGRRAVRGGRTAARVATGRPGCHGGRSFPARMRARGGAGTCRDMPQWGQFRCECVISKKCWSFCQRVRAPRWLPVAFGAHRPGGPPNRKPSSRHFTRRVRNGGRAPPGQACTRWRFDRYFSRSMHSMRKRPPPRAAARTRLPCNRIRLSDNGNRYTISS